MKALQMCKKVKDKVNKEKIINGYVHSIFDSSCNIITRENELISVLTFEKPMAPMSVLIKEKKGLYSLGITQGMEVVLSKSTISFKDVNRNIDLEKSKIWNSTPSFDFTKDQVENILKKIEIIEDFIFKHGKLEGIASIVFNIGEYLNEIDSFIKRDIPLDEYGKFIIKRFVNYLKAVKDKDFKNISSATRDIIGFGPGLTPSTDDFVSGLMVSSIYLSEYSNLNIEESILFNKEMVKDIQNRTTIVSENMLKFASVGEVYETVRNLMITILSKSDEKNLVEIMDQIVEFGHTSGTDILCGVYIGSRLMFNTGIGGN